jgi:hypothetical protein
MSHWPLVPCDIILGLLSTGNATELTQGENGEIQSTTTPRETELVSTFWYSSGISTKGKGTNDLTMGSAPIYIVWKSQQPQNLKRLLRQTPADGNPRAVRSIHFCSIR